MTTELGLLPQSFYEKSRFEEPGKRCRNAITNYCERKNSIRIMSCTDDHISVRDFLRVAENTMKIKYLELSGKEDTENGFLFREGPRDSGISSQRYKKTEK